MDHRSHEEGCMPCRTMCLEVADGMLSPDPGQSHPAGGCPDSKGFKVSGVLTWNTWSCVSRQEGSEFYDIWLQRSFSLDPGSHDSLAGITGGDAGIVWSDECYWILCVCYIFPTPRDLTPIGEARVACFRSKIWLMPVLNSEREELRRGRFSDIRPSCWVVFIGWSNTLIIPLCLEQNMIPHFFTIKLRLKNGKDVIFHMICLRDTGFGLLEALDSVAFWNAKFSGQIPLGGLCSFCLFVSICWLPLLEMTQGLFTPSLEILKWGNLSGHYGPYLFILQAMIISIIISL